MGAHVTSARIGDADFGQPDIHPSAWIAPGAVVVGRVRLGANSSVWYGSVLRADTEDIIIGEQCNIQDLCSLHCDPGEPVVLHDRVSLGHQAMVHGATVEEGALIGIGSNVLGGAHIGAGTLIAAGALVPPGKRVPAGVLFAGVPGRVIRELTDADRASFADTPQHYHERAEEHRRVHWR